MKWLKTLWAFFKSFFSVEQEVSIYDKTMNIKMQRIAALRALENIENKFKEEQSDGENLVTTLLEIKDRLAALNISKKESVRLEAIEPCINHIWCTTYLCWENNNLYITSEHFTDSILEFKTKPTSRASYWRAALRRIPKLIKKLEK